MKRTWLNCIALLIFCSTGLVVGGAGSYQSTNRCLKDPDSNAAKSPSSVSTLPTSTQQKRQKRNIQLTENVHLRLYLFIWICTLQSASQYRGIKESCGELRRLLFMLKHKKSPAESHYCPLRSEGSCCCLTCALTSSLMPFPWWLVFQQQCPPSDLGFNFDANKQQRQLIAELENKNRYGLSFKHQLYISV